MGLLDNNKVIVSPNTGLEGTPFKMLASNDSFDVWEWDKAATGRELRVTFRDMYVWATYNKLWMVKGGITDTPTEIAVNSTNFPNLQQMGSPQRNPHIVRVFACPTTFTFSSGQHYKQVSSIEAQHCRICVVFQNGQVYHNYPACFNDYDFISNTEAKSGVPLDDYFTKFDESVVWDLPSRKHPVQDSADLGSGDGQFDPDVYYYNPALPSGCYDMHPALNAPNGYGNTEGFPAVNTINNISTGEVVAKRARFFRPNMQDYLCNSFNYMGGYAVDNLFTMVATYQGNTGSTPCRICVFGTQDGGRSWYTIYEFGGKDRLKVGSAYKNADGTIGIQLAQSGSVSSGVYEIKRRISIVPSSTDKEPSTLFEYDTAVNVSSISGNASSITVTTASAHGLVKGDAIVMGYQSGASAAGRAFDWMVNDSADAVSGGNGILFKVDNVTANAFTLTLYIWNPDNNLPIRHIHALNKCKDGVSLSGGEQYPFGGWIMYDAIRAADTHAAFNIAKASATNFVRLNSTEDSFQRPLGVIVRQEGKDTFCYIGSDNEFTPMNDVLMPDGRSETFKHNSTGVWKVKLSEIDSHKDNGLLKYNARQCCYCFQEMANAFVFTGQYGDFAVSFDKGESWTSIQLPTGNTNQNIANFSGPTNDGKFSINNILIRLKK